MVLKSGRSEGCCSDDVRRRRIEWKSGEKEKEKKKRRQWTRINV